jgi:oligoribonuclease NrnB/cAMP/cGMP phosphodiesterase (DHH superfamily)
VTALPALEGESIEVRTLYPDPDSFAPDPTAARQEKRTEIRNAVAENRVVVVADDDLDGYGCATILAAYHGADQTGVIHASHTETPDVETVLSMVAAALGAQQERVYVCDLPPNDPAAYVEGIEALAAEATVQIYDHHDEWTEDIRRRLADTSTLVVCDGISGTETTYNDIAEEWPAAADWRDFVALVTDHDLRIDDHPESDRLADAAERVAPAVFRRHAFEHKSTLYAVEPIATTIEEYERKKERKIDLAVQRAAEHHRNGYSIVTTYGRCPSSQTAGTIFDTYDCAVVVLLQPSDEVNIRTTDDLPIAREIADRFGGGGRATAAGATPGWYGADADQIPWTEHWATMGAAARERAVECVATVLDDQ